MMMMMMMSFRCRDHRRLRKALRRVLVVSSFSSSSGLLGEAAFRRRPNKDYY